MTFINISVICLYFFVLYFSQALVLRCDKKAFNTSVSNAVRELRIAVILTATKRNLSTNQCSIYQKRTFPDVVSIQWIIDKLNSPCRNEKFIPQYNIDFTIFDDCGQPEIAASYVYDIYKPFQPKYNLCEAKTNKDTPYIAIISLGDYAVTKSIVESTKHLSVSVISPVIEQMAFKPYKNFISLAIPMEIQVKAAIKLLRELKWVFPGIIYSDNEYGIEMAKILETTANNYGICFSTKKPFSTNVLNEISLFQESFSSGMIYVGEIQDIESFFKIKNVTWIILDISGKLLNNFEKNSNMEGLYVISSSNANSKEFQQYLKKIQISINLNINDSLYQWLKNLLNATQTSSYDIPYNEQLGINARAIMESIYTVTIAKRKECKMLKCLTSLDPKTLRSINVDNQNVPDCFSSSLLGLKVNSVSAILHVYSLKEGIFKKVGDYFSDNNLRLTSSEIKINNNQPSISTPITKYSKICSENVSFNDDIVYISGNIVILGFFSLHNTGFDYNCGDVRKSYTDVIAGEAFLYYVNKSKAINDNVKLGALLLDDCYNPLRTSLNISSILSGETKIKDINTCQIISPSKIVGAIGALSSSVTKTIADIFMQYKIPIISYAASSVDLDDRISYPYFLRTVPSDTQQVKAIIEILKHFGWKYVGLIYAQNNYGLKAKELLLSAAYQSQICVYSFNGIAESKGKNEYNEFDEIFSTSLIKNIKIIIYFGTSSRTIDLLESLNQRKMVNYFTFIGSDAWGKNNLILNYGHLFTGSIIITIKDSNHADFNNETSFKSYLKNRYANLKYLKNPYFKYFWNQEYTCDPSRNASTCTTKDFFDSIIYDYISNQRIIQTRNSVYAIHNGIKKLINEKCNGKMCDEFSSNIDELVLYIKETKILTFLDKVKIFDSHGNGLSGFQFYNIQKNNGVYTYKKIGSYNNKSGLILDDSKIKFYSHDREEISHLETDCPKALECCTAIPTQKISSCDQISDDTVFIIIIVIAIVILWIYKKDKIREYQRQPSLCNLNNENSNSNLNNENPNDNLNNENPNSNLNNDNPNDNLNNENPNDNLNNDNPNDNSNERNSHEYFEMNNTFLKIHA